MTRWTTITPVHNDELHSSGAWRSADFRSPSDYSVDLHDYIDDLDRILPLFKRHNGLPATNDLSLIPLGNLAALFESTLEELQSGRGFVLFCGVDVSRYSELELGLLFLLLGLGIGNPLPQNSAGDLLGAVEDQTWKDRQVRGYRTKERLTFHTDNSDVVGLMCVRSAKSGGESRLASALTVHNLMLDEQPELLTPLYRGYVYDYGADGASNITDHRVPVFSNIDGVVSARLYRPLAEAGMRAVGTPIGPDDMKAFDFIESASQRPDVMLSHTLDPGEFVLFNNYTVLHSRTAFEDYEEHDKRRKLFRLWLNRDGFRLVHPTLR